MDMMRNQRSGHSMMYRLALLTIVVFSCSVAYAQNDTAPAPVTASPAQDSATTGVTEPQLFEAPESLRMVPNFRFSRERQESARAFDDGPVRIASVLPGARTLAGGEATPDPEPTPPQLTQDNIQREARRLQAGVRVGVALDPELIMIGVQSQLGPIFNSNVHFRPSVEFGWGEVTSMFGFNGEFIYSLPQASSRDDRWTPYFGGGLGINLLHQNFVRENGSRRIDFGDFHSDSALNILGGVRYQSGLFMELRTSIYSDPSPTLRVILGYNF